MTFLSSEKRKNINVNIVVNLLVEKNFNVYLPMNWSYSDVDLIFYCEYENIAHKLHIYDRWTIEVGHIGRDLWIAFPYAEEWYLIPHDTMLEQAKAAGFLAMKSWVEAGIHSCPWLSKSLADSCAPYRLATTSDARVSRSDSDSVRRPG